MTKTRDAVVNLAKSWIGKKVSDGSYKAIIDIYNSYGGKLPRGTKMQYGWAWCACTWSALAIKLGYESIMPIEISCYYLIEAAKKMGIWVENDAYVPKPGDAVLYDWDDYAKGDCTGTPDHVGVVAEVYQDRKQILVIEGNNGNAVGYRTIVFDDKYIRGFICPKYDEVESTAIENDDKTKKNSKENRYYYLKDIPSYYRATIDKLIKNGVLSGKGGSGENIVVDLGEDAIRCLVVMDRMQNAGQNDWR